MPQSPFRSPSNVPTDRTLTSVASSPNATQATANVPRHVTLKLRPTRFSQPSSNHGRLPNANMPPPSQSPPSSPVSSPDQTSPVDSQLQAAMALSPLPRIHPSSLLKSSTMRSPRWHRATHGRRPSSPSFGTITHVPVDPSMSAAATVSQSSSSSIVVATNETLRSASIARCLACLPPRRPRRLTSSPRLHWLTTSPAVTVEQRPDDFDLPRHSYRATRSVHIDTVFARVTPCSAGRPPTTRGSPSP